MRIPAAEGRRGAVALLLVCRHSVLVFGGVQALGLALSPSTTPEQPSSSLLHGTGSEGGAAEVPAGPRHKKKKKRRRELVLEEEDYELLEENTGIRRARPAGHRRIKKARDTGRSEAGARTLQEELFGAELDGASTRVLGRHARSWSRSRGPRRVAAAETGRGR